MDIEAALKLKKSEDILKICHEAEAHNCSLQTIDKLYARYYAAVDREQMKWLKKVRGKA